MLQIVLGVILFIKNTQFDTDECCADPCLFFSPTSFPLTPKSLWPQKASTALLWCESWQIESCFTDCQQKRTKPPTKAGRQWQGMEACWSPAGFPTMAEQTLLPGCSRHTAGRGNATHQTAAENFLQINESNQWQGSAPQQPVHKAGLSAFKLTVKPDILLRRARRGSGHKAGQCTHRWTCCAALDPEEILPCSSVLFNLVLCKVQSTHHLCIPGQSQIAALFTVGNSCIAHLNAVSSS